MKASELRIGNLIIDARMILVPLKVVSITQTVVLTDKGTVVIDSIDKQGVDPIEGIPLDGAWFKMLGLEFDDHCSYWFRSPELNIEFTKDVGEKWSVFTLSGYQIAEVEHVHHAQNIIHALTGEELERKDESINLTQHENMK